MSAPLDVQLGSSLPARKRLSHRMKEALYRHPRLDAAVDRWIGGSGTSASSRWARKHLLLRLLPERAHRESPFSQASPMPVLRGSVRILSLVPPEDTGGGSRPARLAVELRRRGYAIDWRWALPIFPWPAQCRPRFPRVEVAHVGDRIDPYRLPEPELVLLEAPHPGLVRLAASSAGGAPIVYDAIDVWDGPLGAGWYDRHAEEAAIAGASHLIASARLLCEEIAARSGRTVDLVANGIDPESFDPARSHPAPADLRRGDPTVVYVGALWGSWVDLDLVAELARTLPRSTVHLIGPAGDRVLPRAPNLFALGARPRSSIPGYLQAADVAIVPFVPDRLAQAVSPLKVFEYLAMRRPVVATRLAELAGVPGVTLAEGPEDFAASVAAAPARPWPGEDVDRYLARQTWAARVDRLLEIVGID